MDSSLDDLVAQGKGRIDRPRKNFSKGGRKQHFTPRYGPKEDGEKGEKEEVPRLQAALKGMDVLNSSLEDIIAVERKSGAGKGNRKGGKSKGKGGKDFRKGQQMFNITTFEDRSKGKGKGGFRPNFGGNFGGGALPEWDFTDRRGRSRSPPAKRHQGTFGRRILVDNIPRNLAAKDLEEAFLEVGKVQDVEVDGGKAWVVFSSAKEAYEAEHRYDGGQINHQIIRVSVK